LCFGNFGVIETEDLTKLFGDFVAVDGVTLAVKPGEVLALLGPNGAGKTTTVRMLTSILKPSRGRARVAGCDVVHDPAGVRASVGVLTENHGLYLRMRADEYLAFFGELYGLSRAASRARGAQLMECFGMGDAWQRRLGEYSKGMRQKLALIRCMLHDPPVLLLDEPTSAMDPQSAKLVRDAIADLQGEKRAIILCTHNLPEAEQLADRIAVIRRGRIIALDSPAQLKRRWLGPAIMELRTAAPIDGALALLADRVQVVAAGADWVRFCTPDAPADNPVILQRLAAKSIPVVTLAEVPRSLEEVYLQVVETKEA
jgi:ABC-2 type transport system ATP-binding protein